MSGTEMSCAATHPAPKLSEELAWTNFHVISLGSDCEAMVRRVFAKSNTRNPEIRYKKPPALY
eukprot:1972342-Rhodomonas_salina.1